MGNQQARLSIQLEEGQVVEAGKIVSGNVFLQLSKTYVQKEGALKITMYGKEKVTIPSSNGNSRTTKAERQFFEAKSVLRRPSKTPIAAGRHCFPFSLRIPHSMPGSTSFPKGTKDIGFRIQYKLCAELVGTVREIHYVHVQSAGLPDTRVPCMLEPVSFPVQGVFFKRGTVSIGAAIDDTHIGRGDKLDLHLACYNDSSADIQRVQVKLCESMTWRTHANQQQASTTLLSMDNVHLPGLDRRGKSVLRRIANSTRSRQAEVYTAIHEALRSRQNKVSLRIPQSSRDTYNGHLIQIAHFIHITFLTKMGTNNPAKSIPLRIGSPPERRSSSTASRPPAPQENRPLRPESPPASARRNQHASEVVYSTAQAQTVIPIVQAVPLVEARDTPAAAELMTDDSDIVVLCEDAIVADLSPSTPAPAAPPDYMDVSITGLLGAMASCVNDYGLIQERLRDQTWVELFKSMTPDEYGMVIAQVRVDFDQTRVASLLVPYVNGGPDIFTCQFAAAAVKNASEWNRSNMAQRLVPLCTDLLQNHTLVRRELNEWEQTVTDRDFEDAITAAAIPKQVPPFRAVADYDIEQI